MGVKSPSLYEYVPNLHGLFDLMFQSGWRQLMDEVTVLSREDADAGDCPGGIYHRISRVLFGATVTAPVSVSPPGRHA